ncbi:DivIVA domain-containing protein [Nocardioides sp.]|uniref:DivIVA domain-containing protein n=1 Tax=Nocardioides sp. TaxID=35761 RepID=UPI00286BE754|nr:DivIVA domain-containing protein [Nocardioides sp.]
MWVFAIVIVLAMGGVAMVAAGRGTPLQPAGDDRPPPLASREGPLGSDDLRRVRFSLAFRGYRMSEVDALLDRLATEREQAEHPQHPQQTDGAPAREARGGDPVP